MQPLLNLWVWLETAAGSLCPPSLICWAQCQHTRAWLGVEAQEALRRSSHLMDAWTECRLPTQHWRINKMFYCTLVKSNWLRKRSHWVQLYSLMNDLQGALLLAALCSSLTATVQTGILADSPLPGSVHHLPALVYLYCKHQHHCILLDSDTSHLNTFTVLYSVHTLAMYTAYDSFFNHFTPASHINTSIIHLHTHHLYTAHLYLIHCSALWLESWGINKVWANNVNIVNVQCQ